MQQRLSRGWVRGVLLLILTSVAGGPWVSGCGSTETMVVEAFPALTASLPAQVSRSQGSYTVTFSATVPGGISATDQAFTLTWGFAGAPPLTQDTFSAAEVGCAVGQTFCQRSFFPFVPSVIDAVGAQYQVTLTVFDREGLSASSTSSVVLVN